MSQWHFKFIWTDHPSVEVTGSEVLKEFIDRCMKTDYLKSDMEERLRYLFKKKTKNDSNTLDK